MFTPLYDELKELRGLNSVKDHLSYVASRREEYSHATSKKPLNNIYQRLKGRT